MPASAKPADAAASHDLFTAPLAETDPEIAEAIAKELGRQRDEIELIASENIVSRAVLEAQGSGGCAGQSCRRSESRSAPA